MPTESELRNARALILKECAIPGGPARGFVMTETNVAAAKKLGKEGLVTTETGEDAGGLLRLLIRLTDDGVEHLKQGGH
jgi:hypothetical protein